MTIILSVVVGIILVLLLGYMVIFNGWKIINWIGCHPLAALFIAVVCIPMLFVALFLVFGALIS